MQILGRERDGEGWQQKELFHSKRSVREWNEYVFAVDAAMRYALDKLGQSWLTFNFNIGFFYNSKAILALNLFWLSIFHICEVVVFCLNW